MDYVNLGNTRSAQCIGLAKADVERGRKPFEQFNTI